MIFNPAFYIASISLPVIDVIISNVGDLDLFFKLTEKTQSRSSSSPYSAPTDVLLSYSYPTSKMMALSYSLLYLLCTSITLGQVGRWVTLTYFPRSQMPTEGNYVNTISLISTLYISYIVYLISILCRPYTNLCQV